MASSIVGSRVPAQAATAVLGVGDLFAAVVAAEFAQH